MKKGMSLIVLVITILVMIILAGVVVVGLSENNPIDSANAAKSLTELSNSASQATLYAADKLSNGYNADGTSKDTKLVITAKEGVDGAIAELDGTKYYTLDPATRKVTKETAAPTKNPTDKNAYFALTTDGYEAIGITESALTNSFYVINCNGVLKLLVGVQDDGNMVDGFVLADDYAAEVAANVSVVSF